MYAVGMLGSYLTQGVYAVVGPFQPFGGAVDIIVVQQEDDSFKSSPWYVKFGDFQGVFKRREKIVDIAVNDVPADFHMFLDNKGEAYFEKEVESDEGMCLALLGASSSTEEDRADGETETLADVQAIVNASSHPEAIHIKTEASPPEQNGVVDCRICPEEKSTTEEEKPEMQEPSKDSNVVPKEDRVFSNMSFQAGLETPLHSKTESSHLEQNGVMGGGICPETKSTTEEEMLEIQEPFSDSNGGLQEERVLSNMSSQAGLETSEAFSTSFGPEALHTQNDIDRMHEVGASNSLTTKIENDFNLTVETSRTNIGVVETGRSNIEEDNISQSSTILTAEEGSCLQAAPFLGAEIVDGLSSDVKVDVEDDTVLVDVGTEEGIEVNGVYKNGYKSSDVDKVFRRFECIKFEGERETHVYSGEESINSDVLDGVGTHEASKDCLVWKSESPLNQDLHDVAIEISHNTTFLLEEKHGGTEIESASLEKEIMCKVNESDEGNTTDGAASQATCVSISSSPSRWRLWPFWFRRSSIGKGSLSTSSVSEQALLAAANVAIGSPFTEELLENNGFYKWQQKAKVRTYVPTSAQLASLKLKDGPNKVTFTFSTVLGKTEVDARIYLWKWNTRIVISDVDGTITKSDVLGQVMPLVGRDWSQYGVTRLFSAIKDNGFEVLFLSARAISQAYLTRRFLLNLKQDGEALPEGPVFISPDGLIPSLYREVIRRAPHEFKISCLEEIRQLFPKDVNPFYAGFGNRETDEISYLKVGIPKGKIFIINPKGEVVVDHRVDRKSYPSLHALVDDMFPPMSSHEQEDFNAWNYWKIPLPDIEEELSMSGSKNVKKVSSSKK